jgi:hypothetical protein
MAEAGKYRRLSGFFGGADLDVGSPPEMRLGSGEKGEKDVEKPARGVRMSQNPPEGCTPNEEVPLTSRVEKTMFRRDSSFRGTTV